MSVVMQAYQTDIPIYVKNNSLNHGETILIKGSYILLCSKDYYYWNNSGRAERRKRIVWTVNVQCLSIQDMYLYCDSEQYQQIYTA